MKQGLVKGERSVAGAQAIRRAMAVIRAVAQLQRAEASLSRVALATGLNQSTAFRILRSLTEERMLYYDEDARSYHLGVLAFELGLATTGKSRVQDAYMPIVEEIARRTRLTTYLMARSGNEAVCLSCIEGVAVIRAKPVEQGQRLPLGIGAGSVAILSTCDDDEIRGIIAAGAPNLDLYPGGRGEIARIVERVEKARRNGYSISCGSVAKGVSGLGVPILPRRGIMQLAISISAVTDVIGEDEGRKLFGVVKSVIDQQAPQAT